MRATLLILLMVFGAASPMVGAEDMQVLRRHFRQSLQDINQARQLESELSHRVHEVTSPLLLAYLGAVQAQIARHTWNPVQKLHYLQKADQTLRQAVASEPDNPEIRFLRFSYQHHVPEFLGFSQDLDRDRSYLVSSLTQSADYGLDAEQVQEMKEFLINSGRCTPEELKTITMGMQ
jgi:hypothetical protein